MAAHDEQSLEEIQRRLEELVEIRLDGLTPAEEAEYIYLVAEEAERLSRRRAFSGLPTSRPGEIRPHA